MQRTKSNDADFSGHDIAQVIKRAEAARAEFLYSHPWPTLKAMGLSVSVLGLAFLLVMGARSPRHQLFENTVAMERLATNLAHAATIAPGTVDKIAQLLHRPDYDCRQVTCEAWLEKRNLAARGKLQAALSRNALQADAAVSR